MQTQMAREFDLHSSQEEHSISVSSAQTAEELGTNAGPRLTAQPAGVLTPQDVHPPLPNLLSMKPRVHTLLPVQRTCGSKMIFGLLA